MRGVDKLEQNLQKIAHFSSTSSWYAAKQSDVLLLVQVERRAGMHFGGFGNDQSVALFERTPVRRWR